MGSSQTQCKSTPSENVVKGLKNKVRLLQGGINEIMAIREIETQVYEDRLFVQAIKQERWKREKGRLKEEIKKLRMRLGKSEERPLKYHMRSTVGMMDLNERCKWEDIQWEIGLEKWKELYFAIKVELDDLIQRTHGGERLCWDSNQEETLEELKKELKAKEGRIESLQAKLASMEDEEIKRQSEVDILRQSSRIMSHGRKLNNKIVQS